MENAVKVRSLIQVITKIKDQNQEVQESLEELEHVLKLLDPQAKFSFPADQLVVDPKGRRVCFFLGLTQTSKGKK